MFFKTWYFCINTKFKHFIVVWCYQFSWLMLFNMIFEIMKIGSFTWFLENRTFKTGNLYVYMFLLIPKVPLMKWQRIYMSTSKLKSTKTFMLICFICHCVKISQECSWWWSLTVRSSSTFHLLLYCWNSTENKIYHGNCDMSP